MLQGLQTHHTTLYTQRTTVHTNAHAILFGVHNAEVFRKAKGALELQSKQAVTGAKRTRGVAFGSGAADEDDSYGMMEDYVVEETDKRRGLLFEVAEGSDEDDMPLVMGR